LIKRKNLKRKSKINFKKAKLSSPIKFKDIMQLNQYELIFWCINAGLLKKPYNCAVCKRRSGKTSAMNLIGKEEYFDKYVWKCSYHNCRSQRMIRTGNILLEQFSRIELRVILIFIFQHFTFMIPAIVSKATLGISLK